MLQVHPPINLVEGFIPAYAAIEGIAPEQYLQTSPFNLALGELASHRPATQAAIWRPNKTSVGGIVFQITQTPGLRRRREGIVENDRRIVLRRLPRSRCDAGHPQRQVADCLVPSFSASSTWESPLFVRAE
jgi:hypothetical protein